MFDTRPDRQPRRDRARVIRTLAPPRHRARSPSTPPPIADAPHVRRGRRDACAIDSYLDIEAIDRGRAAGPERRRLHPGYGFLSENPALARRVRAGRGDVRRPAAEAIELMGDKLRAKQAAREAGRAGRAASPSRRRARPAAELPPARQGRRRRRRARACGSCDAPRSSSGARVRAPRGAGRLRRRPRVHRALPPAGPPPRGPGDRRRPRHRRAPRRARVLAAAPPPEGDRGGALPRRRAPSCAQRSAPRRSRWRAPAATSAPARSSSSPTPTTPPSTTSWR